MTKEELLREQILAKFGSIKKFSEESKIPDSTIRNIFSRGLDGVGVATAIKICRALGLDMESLVDGQLSTRPNAQQDQVWSAFAASDFPSNVTPAEFGKVPLVGRIACGTPILAEQNIEDYVDLPKHIKADYALTCTGDSMVGAGIEEGDIVYIKMDARVDNGQIAAVLIGEEATLKRLYRADEGVTLVAENPKYPPIQLRGTDAENVRLLGLAVAFTHPLI